MFNSHIFSESIPLNYCRCPVESVICARAIGTRDGGGTRSANANRAHPLRAIAHTFAELPPAGSRGTPHLRWAS